MRFGEGGLHMRRWAGVISCACIFLCFSPRAAFGQEHWQVVESGLASSLRAVAFGNGTWVAVGDSGSVVTSLDGVSWTQRASGAIENLTSIAFGDGRFVALRANIDSPALTSVDGITWSPVTVRDAAGSPQTTHAFGMIAFGDGHFLITGHWNSATEFITSDDGINFAKVTVVGSHPWFTDQLSQFMFFRGRFYVGSNYYGQPLASSTDGREWNSVHWGNPVSILATDGVTKLSLGPSRFSIDAGFSVQTGPGLAYRYADKDPRRTGYVQAIVYGKNSVVAVDAQARPWISERGGYWLPLPSLARSDEMLTAVAFDGISRFVTVGSAPAGGQALIATALEDPPRTGRTYSVRSLKQLTNGVLTEVRSINNEGVIAGAAGNMAVTVRDRTATYYDTTDYAATVANAVNQAGVVAAEVNVGYFGVRRITWSLQLPGRRILYPLGNISATAPSINAAGIIAGAYQNYPGTAEKHGLYVFDTTAGQLTDFGTLGTMAISVGGINDAGQIAGVADGKPFRRSPEGAMTFLPNLAGVPLDDFACRVAGINASGQLAGYSNMPYRPVYLYSEHAFFLSENQVFDIDTWNSPRSAAFGLNDLGEVVGQFQLEDGGQQRAFLYLDGRMRDLNDLLDASGDGWALQSAVGINNAGQIVGIGWRHNWESEPFIATPISGLPTGVPTRFRNISTRLAGGSGDSVPIGGFIVRGGTRRMVIRALGPALEGQVPDWMVDPTLEIVDSAGRRVAYNDDYSDLTYAEQNELGVYRLSLHFGSGRDLDSCLLINLGEGSYTAIVRGKNGGTGNCLLEVYNVDTDHTPGLVNISTRGPVGLGDSVMIAGFIINGTREKRVLVRAQGPSLSQAGVPNVLANPTLELHDSEGVIAMNNDWRATQESEIAATGLAPGNEREPAVILSLLPGAYTAIVRGDAQTTGNALVEVYELD